MKAPGATGSWSLLVTGFHGWYLLSTAAALSLQLHIDKMRWLLLSWLDQMELFFFFLSLHSVLHSGVTVSDAATLACGDAGVSVRSPLKAQSHFPQSQVLSSAPIKTSMCHHRESNEKNTRHTHAHVRRH